MSSYYYILASLPHLEFESDYIPDPADFLDLCRLFLSESDMRIVESATLHPHAEAPAETAPETAAVPLLEKFRHWEIGLRNELAKQRSQILNREAAIRLNDDGSDCTAVSGLADSVKLIMQSATPLEADIGLDRLRWQYLNELGSGHYFNVQQLIVYYLRLRIRIRRDRLTADSGIAAYNEQMNGVRNEKSYG
ncbi:MAG: hypothetical protein ACR2PY_09405 [Salinispira sp.]